MNDIVDGKGEHADDVTSRKVPDMLRSRRRIASGPQREYADYWLAMSVVCCYAADHFLAFDDITAMVLPYILNSAYLTSLTG
jgi:hypothetical protein